MHHLCCAVGLRRHLYTFVLILGLQMLVSSQLLFHIPGDLHPVEGSVVVNSDRCRMSHRLIDIGCSWSARNRCRRGQPHVGGSHGEERWRR